MSFEFNETSVVPKLSKTSFDLPPRTSQLKDFSPIYDQLSKPYNSDATKIHAYCSVNVTTPTLEYMLIRLAEYCEVFVIQR